MLSAHTLVPSDEGLSKKVSCQRQAASCDSSFQPWVPYSSLQEEYCFIVNVRSFLHYVAGGFCERKDVLGRCQRHWKMHHGLHGIGRVAVVPWMRSI